MKVKINTPSLEATKCRCRKASVARTCFVGPRLFLATLGTLGTVSDCLKSRLRLGCTLRVFRAAVKTPLHRRPRISRKSKSPKLGGAEKAKRRGAFGLARR